MTGRRNRPSLCSTQRRGRYRIHSPQDARRGGGEAAGRFNARARRSLTGSVSGPCSHTPSARACSYIASNNLRLRSKSGGDARFSSSSKRCSVCGFACRTWSTLSDGPWCSRAKRPPAPSGLISSSPVRRTKQRQGRAGWPALPRRRYVDNGLEPRQPRRRGLKRVCGRSASAVHGRVIPISRIIAAATPDSAAATSRWPVRSSSPARPRWQRAASGCMPSWSASASASR